jgi:nucleotide-binding universal stress UspA family protein
MKIMLLACPPTPRIEKMMGFGEEIISKLGGHITALCVSSDIAQKFYSPFSIQLGDANKGDEERAFRRIQASGEVRKLKRGGEFVSTVLDEVEKGGFDMLIFDDHDPGITRKIAEYSHIPTLICRREGDVKNFLVCTDGSEHATRAAVFAGKIAKAVGGSVTLLAVARTEEERPRREEALKRVRTALEKEVSGLEVREKMGKGRVRDAILEEEPNHDLVIITPRGLSKLERMVMGHVSLHVLEKSKNNVLLVW